MQYSNLEKDITQRSSNLFSFFFLLSLIAFFLFENYRVQAFFITLISTIILTATILYFLLDSKVRKKVKNKAYLDMLSSFSSMSKEISKEKDLSFYNYSFSNNLIDRPLFLNYYTNLNKTTFDSQEKSDLFKLMIFTQMNDTIDDFSYTEELCLYLTNKKAPRNNFLLMLMDMDFMKTPDKSDSGKGVMDKYFNNFIFNSGWHSDFPSHSKFIGYTTDNQQVNSFPVLISEFASILEQENSYNQLTYTKPQLRLLKRKLEAYLQKIVILNNNNHSHSVSLELLKIALDYINEKDLISPDDENSDLKYK